MADTFSPTVAPQASDPRFQYESLLLIGRMIAQADSTEAALQSLYDLLRARHGLLAMALEVRSGPYTHYTPFGDPEFLAALAQEEIPESAYRTDVLPLRDAAAPPGEIAYVFDESSSVPQELLELATAQIALRLGQETLMKRAEEAEDKARQRISEVAAIYEIGQAVDEIERTDLLNLITERTARLMDAQACSLMLLDEETGVLRVEAQFGLPEDALNSEQRIGEGIAGRVVVTNEPILIAGSRSMPPLEGLTLRPEISSSMLVPMRNREGHPIGVVAIRRRRPAPDFTDDDLKLFSVFAKQASLAVTNFHLYDNLERRANELTTISTLTRALISTLDLDELLSRVTEDICQVVGFKRCCLFLRDSQRALYVPRVWRGYPDTIGRNPVREGEGAVGTTARQKTLLVFDARQPVSLEREKERGHLQQKGFARSLGTDAFVIAPILNSQNRCLGVVVADNRGRREPISAEQISLLTAFVNQAGIAIENAFLYDDLQATNRNILRQKNFIDGVLQHSLAGIISIDSRGYIAHWNRAAEQTLRRAAYHFRHATFPDLVDSLHLPDTEKHVLLAMIRRVQETGDPFHQPKFTLHPAEGEVVTLDLMVSRLPDHHPERAGVVLNFVDVTQEVRLEAKLKEMHRLADIGQLAAKMAHEVRNALFPIRGAAQMMRETGDDGAEWPDMIIAEVDNLSRLTSEMLDFARPIALDPRPMHVEHFLMSSLQLLAPFLDEHLVTVKFQFAEALPELQADPIQLGQVVRNIVLNAVQAMPQGGLLTLEAEYDQRTRMLLLRFQDTGVGIPEEDLERIFRPFVTTRTKGTGLGLPIVQKIVNHHGGQVSVVSRVGEGTCFTVSLPLLPPHSIIPPEAPPLISPKPAGPFPDN
jgi:PAS domain S-box-containing protein